MPTETPEETAGQVTTENLFEDLKAVVRDAEALLQATEGQAGEKISEIRARAEESLRGARQRLQGAGGRIEARARAAAHSADAYVRKNPWAAVAIAAGIGYLLGSFDRRR